MRAQRRIRRSLFVSSLVLPLSWSFRLLGAPPSDAGKDARHCSARHKRLSSAVSTRRARSIRDAARGVEILALYLCALRFFFLGPYFLRAARSQAWRFLRALAERPLIL